MKSYIVFLSRHKLFTTIQAIGLIISIAFIILIGNYVWQQYSLAYSNPYSDRIYAVGTLELPSLSSDDKYEFDSKLPSLESSARYGSPDFYLKIDNEYVKFSSIQTDKELFAMFPEIELTSGNLNNIREESILISEEMANKYFPDREAVGENLSMSSGNFEKKYVVEGVFRINQRGMIKPVDVIQFYSDESVATDEPKFNNIGSVITFLKVSSGTDREDLLKDVIKIDRPNYDEYFVKDFALYSLPELYFTENAWNLKNGNKTLLKIMSGVVILLLISSIINYINLSLSLVGQRAKDVATRRLHGASKTSIILGSIRESLIFVTICSCIGLGLAYIFRAPIDNLLFQTLIYSEDSQWRFVHLTITWNVASVFIFIGFILLLGVLSGFMPAIYSSGFKPIDIVRGNFRVRNRMVFGKIFIVIQNVISVLLISLSIVMESQLNHLYHRPLFAQKDNVYFLRADFRKYKWALPLINSLEGIPEVRRIGYGESYPGRIANAQKFYKDKDKNPEESVNLYFLEGDKNYFDIMNLDVLQGDKDPQGNNLIYLSESAYNFFDLTGENLVSFLQVYKDRTGYDFNFEGSYRDIPTEIATTEQINPYSTFLIRTDSIIYGNCLLIEVNSESKEVEGKIMDAYNNYRQEFWRYYEEPYSNGFISELEKQNLSKIKSTMVLLEIFMGISVLLSLLGLIAMSTYYANENTKGIAIRKVLGSDVKGEIWRNTRIYMILVVIAISVAVPLSVVISKEYLSRYAYRIENYWWIFIVASVGSLLVAFLSVYWQISRSAHVNPATELKKE